MSDEFISDTSKLFQVGQTLRAKVTEVDGEKKRFLVSLKASDCCHGDGDADSGVTGLEVFFREKDRAELSLRDKKGKQQSTRHVLQVTMLYSLPVSLL